MQCQAINKGNGNQCKRNAESESFFCKAHAALASQPLFTIVDAEASAPAMKKNAFAAVIGLYLLSFGIYQMSRIVKACGGRSRCRLRVTVHRFATC